MIDLNKIIQCIKPQKTIINKEVFISKMIQLDSDNERDDVLMWVSSKNISALSTLRRGTIICPEFDLNLAHKGCNYIITNNPRHAFRLVLNDFFIEKPVFEISNSSKIHPSVKYGKNVFIGENVVIEKNCTVGENVVIGHNTVIHAHTIINNNVQIGCNCVIGSVGFGYEKDEDGSYVFIPHIGNVILEENVEIGNCTIIDRAVMGSTILKKNVKVDNLVHIAHGVEIGENSLIIANAMIGGSTKIGKNVWVAPSSSLINKIEIGDNVIIGLGAVVVKTVKENTTVVGNPARALDKK